MKNHLYVVFFVITLFFLLFLLREQVVLSQNYICQEDSDDGHPGWNGKRSDG